MVPEPRIVESRIWATVPDELLLTDRESRFTRDLFHGNKIGSFLEGPSFDRDGNLYTVDIAHGRIFRISPQGDFTVVAQYDGGPNGLKLHKDGRIFVADRFNGVMLIDPVNGKVETFIGPDKLPGYKGLNDLFFASNGDLYFTDQGGTGLHDPTGRLWRYSPDGALTCLIDNIPSPNGLVMNPKEDTLYLAVTRANAVWRVPFDPDGTVNRAGLFCQLVGGWGPDGMAIDRAGNVVIAHAGFGSVWLWSPLGLPLIRITSCDGGLLTTNIAYGGQENRTLFITNSLNNNILIAEMPEPGEPMYALMDET